MNTKCVARKIANDADVYLPLDLTANLIFTAIRGENKRYRKIGQTFVLAFTKSTAARSNPSALPSLICLKLNRNLLL